MDAPIERRPPRLEDVEIVEELVATDLTWSRRLYLAGRPRGRPELVALGPTGPDGRPAYWQSPN